MVDIVIFPRQDITEIRGVLERMTTTLLTATSNNPFGRQASAVRQAIGDLMDNLGDLVRLGGLSSQLLKCFKTATDVGVSLIWFDKLIDDLFEEETEGLLATITTQTCIVYALSQEARIIAGMTFTNREAVDATMARMKVIFDQAKEVAADHMDSGSYLSIITMGANLVHHLVKTAQPLPRIVEYVFATPFTALFLSNRIYGDGSRWEEITQANRVIHPAFVRPNVRAMSS